MILFYSTSIDNDNIEGYLGINFGIGLEKVQEMVSKILN